MWILKIDGATDNLGIFKTKEEGINAAFRLISESFTNISGTIDEVLKQRHTKACKALIKKFKDIENLRTLDFFDILCKAFNEHGHDASDTSALIKENSFLVEMLRGESVIFSFSFGEVPNDISIETNIWDEETQNYFLFARTKNERIKYSLHKKETLSSVANIFLVYDALTTTPQLRRELKKEIIHKYNDSPWGYEINLSDDTISNQIDALKKLGIPIYDRRLNNNDRENQNDLICFYGNRYKEGFYLDYERPLTPDYSNIKPRSYIMLVYLTLKEIDKAHALSTQQQIIDAVYNKFGIKLQRQKVKNYLDLLIKLGSGIKHDKSGYWMK